MESGTSDIRRVSSENGDSDKKRAGVFLDALSALAYKETKKNGEFVLPGFGTTRSRHTIHIRLQCPEDSILKANLVKLVNARYKQRV